MKRLIWGIVLLAFGLLFFASAGNNPQGPMGSIMMGGLSLAGGGWLANCGFRFLKQRTVVGESALRLLRKYGRIDGLRLAAETEVGEVCARKILADLQRTGVVPLNAEVV